MSDFLTEGLKKAIARAALDKHRETCEVCTNDHDCVIAKHHLSVISPGQADPQ